MTQDDKWLDKYNEVVAFIVTNKRNPSKHDDEERGLYLNWIKHNRKLMNSREMKEERVVLFKDLLAMMEECKRVNQYQ
ncbi:MAG: hypothetical protein IKN59_06360 [Paludibacteraceae bacterium]|nr:hypothetical protein [Paludibacteraceae bacterium]